MKKIIFLFLSVLLLFSCSSRQNYEELYQNQKYDEIIASATSVIEKKLDNSSLYYRMLSYCHRGLYDEAALDAGLYVLLYAEKFDDRLKSALKISVNFDGNTDAAVVLSENYDLSKDEAKTVFSVLMKGGAWDEAERLYQKVRGYFTAEEATSLLISSGASSRAILQELEAWREESNDWNAIELALYKCVPIFTSRGEASLLLPLLIEIYEKTGSNYSALILGDLYISNGNQQKARLYWNSAGESYPVSVERRLNSLHP